jgi:hypothetical protein
MVDFVASHFFEIERLLLVKFPRTIIIQILSSESLRIESEDSLYEFTREGIEKDCNDFEMLEFIQFEYLSCGKMSDFIEWSCESHEVFRDLFSMRIWRAICVRLGLKVSPESRNRRLTFPKERIVPSGDECLDGIIAHLTRKYSGNVHDLGIVSASSSTTDNSHIARNATELNTKNHFHSLNEPNQWLCYDFKDRWIRLMHYSIYTGHHLRDWKVEGSNDNLNWSCLDERHDSTTNSGHPIGTFSVSKENEREYRFIRLLQTGKCTQNNDYLILYAFEVFGDLLESGENK